MTKEELEKKHELYGENIDEWNLYILAYNGGKKFVQYALHKHSRESTANWKERLNEAVYFNYTKSIIDLFNFYLTEKPAARKLATLEQNELWNMFFKDCDLQGNNFDIYMKELQKISSICGSLGILVDKPKGNVKKRSSAIKDKIYPYCVHYTLPNILDWRFERNNNSGRYELIYLKLKEDDGFYNVWTKTTWERWKTEENVQDNEEAQLVGGEPHNLGEIPFIWMPNQRRIGHDWFLGVSDIVEISQISASIIRNMSCGEELIKFAGFPIMRKPMPSADEEQPEDNVGVRGILEFDPEHQEAGKPDWLESEIAEPINAILGWVDRKVDETFRVAHLSGVHGQRKSNNEVSSGLALRYEFMQLNSVLSQKSVNLTEAELSIIHLWMKWENEDKAFEDVDISRDQNFSIDDLSINLDNSFKAIDEIPSQTFAKLTHQQIVKQMLPNLTDTKYIKIDQELDALPEPDSSKKDDDDDKDKNLP